jgi:SAM-dependent methyltransferase
VQGGQDKSLWRRDGEIFLVSVLILYLELVLIRWIGTEIRIFAFLGNLVLVICFFGVGLGCYRASQSAELARMGITLLVLVVLVSNPLHIRWLDLNLVTFLLSGFEESPMWQPIAEWSGLYIVGALVIVGVLLYLIAFAFVPAGQMLGRAFQEHPRVIRAYSFNVAGSLVGVWLFNAMSWISTPPALWFAVFALLLLPLEGGRSWRRWVTVVTVGAAAFLTWEGPSPTGKAIWSPYHRLTLSPFVAEEGTNRVEQGYVLEVSGAFYQHLLNLSEPFLKLHPAVFDMEQVRHSAYNLPFSFKRPIHRMLIVGAGAGNNAAAALRHGVEQVDCVEIDPRIYELGRQLHPERPYDSPRVRMILNDARAVFKTTSGPYDVIWFGWLDSVILGSTYNNLRQDNYVYTRESIHEAKRLLAEDGLIILSFAFERRWIADRLFGLLREEFGHDPLAYQVADIPRKCGGGGNLTLVSGRTPVTAESMGDQSAWGFVQAHLSRFSGATRPTTDDWPYLYLQRARIPKLHLLVSLTILGTVRLARRRVFGLKHGLDWHFFALGAAFLLLEVQTVSRATLLFGMTWIVNAIIISALLVMILLANLVAARRPRFAQWLVVAGLAVTIVALALVPLDWFNALTGASKLVAASAFLTAPVFFAGLIFIRSFAASGDKSRALGSNLIGALVGGLLESLSFVTGIRALVLLVGLFYAVALLLRPRLLQQDRTAG